MADTALMADQIFTYNLGAAFADISLRGIEDVDFDASSSIDDLHDKYANGWLGDPTESPIERLLWSEILFCSDGYNPICVLNGPEENYTKFCTWVSPQYSIGKYRADFMFCACFGGKRQLIAVECDGHDFHERTKEQARRDKARDRYFVKNDIKVLRFTGSEIYADTKKCIEEIEIVLCRAIDVFVMESLA